MPTITYTATAVVGTCTITATEAIGAKTGSVTITQTAPPNAIAFTPNNAGGASISVDANGTVKSFTTTTTNTGNSAAVQGDTLTFTTSGGAACGTIGNIFPTGGVSDAAGHVTSDYTASRTVGFCTITAMESATGATNSVLVTQNVPGQGGHNTSSLGGTTTSAANQQCSFSGICVFANGKDTAALTDQAHGFCSILGRVGAGELLGH
jgi:hypothetical protein